MQSLTIEFIILSDLHYTSMHSPVEFRVLTQRHIGIFHRFQEIFINKNIKLEEASVAGWRGNATLIPIGFKRVWNIIP